MFLDNFESNNDDGSHIELKQLNPSIGIEILHEKTQNIHVYMLPDIVLHSVPLNGC